MNNQNVSTLQMDGLEKCKPPADSPFASILADMVRSALAWENTNGSPNQSVNSFQHRLTSVDIRHKLDNYEIVSGGAQDDCGN